MKNFNLKLISLISIQLFVSYSVMAATCKQTVPDSALVKKGTLVMSTNPTLPPLQFVDSTGKLKGMRITLGKEVAKRLCLKPEYIRIEFSGITKLDQLNKNINSNWFNAILSLLVIFVLIKTIPGLLNWLFFDANFIGTTKEECTGDGACWLFIRFWITRFMYGLYPDAEIWRINAAFLMLIGTVITAFFDGPKIKKYIKLPL